MKLRSQIRYLAEFLPGLVLMSLIRLTGLELGGRLACFITCRIAPRLRVHKIALANLRAAFPDKNDDEIDQLAMQMWENIGLVIAEYCNLRQLRRESSKRLKIIGEENALKAVEEGRGLILFSAHMANWEAMSMAIDLVGLDAVGVYRHANNPLFNKWMIRQRVRNVIPVQVPKGADGAKALVRSLKAGKTLCMLIDQKMNDGVPATFFGRPAMTASAAAGLALRYHVPVMLISAKRLQGSHFEVTFHAPFEAAKDGSQTKDILDTTQKMNDLMERIIRQSPAHWLWMHQRWS